MNNHLSNIVVVQPKGGSVLFAFMRDEHKPILADSTMAEEVKGLPSVYDIIAKISVDEKMNIHVVKGHKLFLKKGVKLHFDYMPKNSFFTVEKFDFDTVKNNLFVHLDSGGQKTRILFSRLDSTNNCTYFKEAESDLQIPFTSLPLLSYNDLINEFDLDENQKQNIYNLALNKAAQISK